ncbi:MAG: hypothetical protein ACRC8S_12990 [Fimbriiglobus sp.]
MPVTATDGNQPKPVIPNSGLPESTLQLIRQLQSIQPELPNPASMTSLGGVGYQWNQDCQILTIDVEADGSAVWFYSDSEQSIYEGEEFTPASLPAKLIHRLTHFVR